MANDLTAGRPADQTRPVFPFLQTASDVATNVREDIERGFDELVAFLASPRGKALRSKLAMGVITVAPLIARAPIVRRNPLLKLLGVAGFAALLVKVAEAVRDWEPAPPPAAG
ncbi:MAG: hypothetical protein ACRDKG_11175 [Actinomycetota bacterium]